VYEKPQQLLFSTGFSKAGFGQVQLWMAEWRQHASAHMHMFSCLHNRYKSTRKFKENQNRSTKKFQAPCLAKGGLELFGRTICAERQVSRSLLRHSGRKQQKVEQQRNRSTANFQATLSPGRSPGSLLSNDVFWMFSSLCVSTLLRLATLHMSVHGQDLQDKYIDMQTQRKANDFC
jgi:hypothetical protein